MDIQYYGGNCVRIVTKKAAVVVDDNLASLGLKSVTKPDDIALQTNKTVPVAGPSKFAINSAGEFEVSGVSVQSISAKAHGDGDDIKTGTIFRLIIDDIIVVITGSVSPDLSDAQLEALGHVDVLIVPVGGFGLSIDSVDALKLIKKIEPGLVIPTHYQDKGVKYPVEQQSLEEALKGLAMEARETVPKLKLKPADLSEVTELVVLERQ